MGQERVATIRLKVGMIDPLGKLLPRGRKEQMTAEIADGVATFWFKEGSSTKHFAKVVMALEKKRGANDTAYLERFNKIVTKYPGKTKEDIRDLILRQLKQLGLNAKANLRK